MDILHCLSEVKNLLDGQFMNFDNSVHSKGANDIGDVKNCDWFSIFIQWQSVRVVFYLVL